MLKWLTVIGTAALIVTVIFVARYDHFHSTEGKGYNINCTQPNDPASTVNDLVCTAEHTQKTKSGEYDPVWWHIFFTWPEGITALLLLLTLGVVSMQAYLMRVHAEHFENLANYVAATQRAWIENKILEQPTSDVVQVDEKPNTWGWYVGIVLRNTGKTACRVIDSHMRIEMVDSIDSNARPVVPKLPAVPIYRIPNDKPVQIAPKGTVWLPKKKFTYSAVIPKGFLMIDFLKWKTSEKVLCIYGFVEYEDAFNEKRVTRFCYAYIPIQSDFAMTSDRTGEALLPPGFELSGPAAYNEST